MNVSLPKDLERLVNEKVKSGLYPTPNEVLREGLRLLEERDRFYQRRLEQLRGDVRKGIEQLESAAGRPLDRAGLKERLAREFGGARGRRKAK